MSKLFNFNINIKASIVFIFGTQLLRFDQSRDEAKSEFTGNGNNGWWIDLPSPTTNSHFDALAHCSRTCSLALLAEDFRCQHAAAIHIARAAIDRRNTAM